MKIFYTIFALLSFYAPTASAQQPASSPAGQQLDSALTRARRLLHADPVEGLRQGRLVLARARQLADARREGQCLTFLTTVADHAAEPEEALHYGHQALALARQHGDSVAAGRACQGLAAALGNRHDTTNAARYLHLGLRLTTAERRGYAVRGELLQGLATHHFRAGRFVKSLEQALQARRYLHRGAEPSEPLLSATDGLIAACYSALGDEGQARRILGPALARDRQAGCLPLVVAHLTTLSHSLLTDQAGAGLDTLQVALRLAQRLGLREEELRCYEEYYKYYASVGNYHDAYPWLERHRQLDEQLNEHQQQQTLLVLNSKYEAQAREERILSLDQRSRIDHLERSQQQARNRQLLALVAVLTLSLGAAATVAWQLKRRDQLLARQNAALTAATAAAQTHAAAAAAHAAARDRLYAIVAHDLRGPVASFTGVSQLIELYLQQKDGAGLQQVTALVRQTARNLNELLHNLLGWTLSQTGELSYNPDHLLLAPVLAEIRHLYAASAHSRRIRLELAPVAPTLHVWADSQMVQTILRNLVGNALKFAPQGGHLRLSAAPLDGPDGPLVCLEVADDGSGMNARQIQALLGAPAGAAPPPTAHDPRAGTGLGLSLCLAFVRRQGGTLTIASEPGVGTTVRVCLPVRAPAPAAESSTPKATQLQSLVRV